jgi:hypothetical protein
MSFLNKSVDTAGRAVSVEQPELGDSAKTGQISLLYSRWLEKNNFILLEAWCSVEGWMRLG